MSKKKQQIVQEVITNDEQWAEFMSRDGLKVVDAFTDWCGECHALKSFYKSLKTEIGDPLLMFATANCDKIEALQKYAGFSEPTTLFFGKDVLMNVIRGANSPVIEALTRSGLELEHDCVENGAERVEYVNEVEPEPVEDAAQNEEPEEAAPIKTFTFAVIKASAVADGTADAIFADIAEAGFKVESGCIDDVVLDEESAKVMFAHLAETEGFEDFVQSMVGTVKKCVLSNAKDDAVTTLLKLMAPTPPAADGGEEEKKEGDEAKEGEEKKEAEGDEPKAVEGEEPTPTVEELVESPLAKYSEVLFASADAENAETEIKFAFADWAATNLVAPTEETSDDVTATTTTTEEGGDTPTATEPATDGGGDAAEEEKKEEETKVEETKAEETKPEETKAEETKVEETKAEETKETTETDEAKTDEATTEPAKVEETTETGTEKTAESKEEEKTEAKEEEKPTEEKASKA